MRLRPGHRSALISAVAGVATLALAAPAWANSTIPLHHSKVTAGTFDTQECDDERFAGKATDHDGWHFVLPGRATGSFVSLTLKFTDLGGEEVTINIPDGGDPYPDSFYNAGDRTIHAYLFTPAGWVLETGTADITGTGDKFNLSHTCPGTPDDPGPSTPPVTPPATPPATDDPETPESPGASEPPGTPGDGGEGGGLPVTGAAAGTMALAGLVLIGGGATLVVMRRRRNITFSA